MAILLLLAASACVRDSKRKYESLKALKVRDLKRHCECHQHKESAEAFFPNIYISTFQFYR